MTLLPRSRRRSWRSIWRTLTIVFPVSLVAGPLAAQQGADTTRSLGVSIGVVDSATIAASGARTLSELLAARVAGVSVLRSSGVVGAGSRVRFRGASSFFALREPIVVVDGVRVDATQNTSGLGRGGQQPSRLDDIDLGQVNRVEILRGPAASALYGTDAAGGVIRITTRTPHRGKPTWGIDAEGGASEDETDYPVNFSTGSGSPRALSCTRAGATLGTCTAGPLLSWNPLERASPFRTGTQAAVRAGLSGGNRWLGYVAGGSAREEHGVLAPNAMTRYSARVNVDVDPFPSLRLALRTSYVDSHVTLPSGDGNIADMLMAGLTGNAIDDSVDRGFRSEVLPGAGDVAPDERIVRTTGSLTANLKATSWLTARASVGSESVHRNDALAAGLGQASTAPVWTVFDSSAGRNTHRTFSGGATARFQLADSITTETTAGIERLTSGMHSLDSREIRTPSPITASRFWTRRELGVTGLLASQRLSWADRRFLGVGIRHDRWSLTKFLPSTFWSADAAWVIGDEPFFPRSTSFSKLRVRGAYGRSTDFRTYAVVPESSLPPTSQVAPSPLTGETISELELGMDALVFDRVWVETTWYRQQSKDALMMACCSGYPADPVAAWHTTGLDMTLSAALVRSVRANWSARLNASLLSNRVDGFGPDRKGPSGAALLPLVRLQSLPGRPIAGIWGNPSRVHDDNGDGVITPAEVDVDKDPIYLGSSIPTRELGLASTLALRGVTFSVLFDYRGGFKQLNATEGFRCDLQVCGALYDPSASLDDQARAISVLRSGAGFVENASFARLREASVTWKLFPASADRNGFPRLSLTIAGRNLFTVSGYSGFDPEVNAAGQFGLGVGDFLTVPLPRTVTLRLDVQR